MAVYAGMAQEGRSSGGKLSDDNSLGKIEDCEGSVLIKPVMHDRWTAAGENTRIFAGDLVKTAARGANAALLTLKNGATLIIGPGAHAEIVDLLTVRLLDGEMEAAAPKGASMTVVGAKGASAKIEGSGCFRSFKEAFSILEKPPRWLTDYKNNQSTEAVGSLLCKIDGRDVPLSIGYHKVVIDVRDQIARTVVEESFVNHTTAVLEGVFYFPLPQDASISGFGMWIGDELVEADVVEKERARFIYETILSEKRDPGLLEWTGGNIFKARVYPINAEKRIKITYTQVLPKTGGVFRYNYSLKSELLKLNPLKRLSIDFRLYSADPLVSIACPTHECRIDSTASAARVEFEAEEYVPSRDFEVRIETKASESGLSFVRHVRDKDGYFMLLLDAPKPAKASARQEIENSQPMDFLVMADTSGSMRGDPREAQLRFIDALLESLSESDTFNVMTMDVIPRFTFEKPSACGADAKKKAMEFIEKRGTLGWTDLDRAFAAAADRAQARTQVVYVGDGILTTGDADPQAFAKRLAALYKGRGSFHAVATGSSYESTVLKAIAALGMGSARVLSEEIPPSKAAFMLLREITSPAIKDLKVEFSGISTAAVYPEVIPNLPEGSQQIVIGRFMPGSESSKCSVSVKGAYDGKPVVYSTDVALSDPAADNSFIPRLWARMHLDHLLSQGQSQEIKDRIITLSEDYNIITPYTSLLVLESDEDRARFNVKKRMRMRDAEEFFAQGREAGSFELRHKQMQKAKQWRLNLRADVLAGLEDMDRTLTDLLGGSSWGLYEVEKATRTGGAAGGRRAYGARYRNGGGEEEMSKGDDSAPGEAGKPLGDPGAPEPVFGEDEGGEEGSPAEPSDHNETDEDSPAGGPAFADSESPAERMAESKDQMAGESLRIDRKSGYLGGRSGRGPVPSATPMPRAERGATGFAAAPEALDIRNWGFPGLPGKPAAKPVPKWSAEVLALVAKLDRRAGVAALAGGMRISLDSTISDRRGAVIRKVAAEYLVSGDAWAVRSPHDEGSSYSLDWCSGGERGVLYADWLLGRIRKSEEGDKASWPEPVRYFFGDSISSLSGLEATLKAVDGKKSEITLRNPSSPDWSLVLVIDTETQAVIEEMHISEGKVTSSTTFGDFAESGGMALPRLLTIKDEEGMAVCAIRIAHNALDKAAFDSAMAAVLAAKANAILIPKTPEKIEEARQAFADGKADMADSLVLASDFASTGQWEKAEPHVATFLFLAGPQWGAASVELRFRAQSRRNEELKNLIHKTAAALAGARRDAEQSCADLLLGLAGNLNAGNERMAVLAALKPVFQRRDPTAPAMLRWSREEISCLHNMNREDLAFEKYREIAEKHPTVADAHVAYANMLANRGEVDKAASWLKDAEKKHAPWLEGEIQNLRSTAATTMANASRIDAFVELIEAWERDIPGGIPAHILNMYLSALLILDREDKAKSLAVSWASGLRKEPPAKGEESRLHAALLYLSGQGWYIWRDRLDKDELGILAETALHFAGSKKHSWYAAMVIENYRFQRTDEGQAVLKTLFARLESGIQAMPAMEARNLVQWLIQSHRPAGVQEAWKKIFAVVMSRWEAEKNEDEKEQLANVLENWADADTKLAFFRKSYVSAPEGPERLSAASRLFEALLAGKWSTDVRKEILEIIPEFSKKIEGEDAGAEADRTIFAFFRFVSWFPEARAKAAVESLKGVNEMPRRILAAERKKALREAMAEAAEFLGSLEKSFEPALLRPWMSLDRIYFRARLRSDPASLRDQTEGLRKSHADAGGTGKDAAQRDRIFAQRCVATLTNLAVRASEAGMLRELMETSIKAGEKAVDWQEALYRLLVALDMGDDLEKALRGWFAAGDAVQKTRWGRDLAFILAERDKVEEAAAVMEEIADKGALQHDDFRALADWHTALGNREASERAKIMSWEVLGEWTISNRLSNEYYSKYSRYGDDVPGELDAEIPVMFIAMFRKSAYPENHVWQISNYYRCTRDFRLLECIPEGVLGHSSQGIYPFLNSFYQVMESIGEEAVIDRIIKHLEAVGARAKTDVDKRALRLLTFMAEYRAATQANGAGPHMERALAALKEAFKGRWEDGEPEQMAYYLSARGALSHRSLADEQLKQLRALAFLPAEGSYGRLAVAGHLAGLEWGMGLRSEAVRTISAALDAFRAANAGALPDSANNHLQQRGTYLEQTGEYMTAEKMWLAELSSPRNPQRHVWLRQCLYQLYHRALVAGAEVGLGKGEKLYAALRDAIPRELSIQTNEYDADALVDVMCGIFKSAWERKFPSVRKDVSEFAFRTIPAVLGIYKHRNCSGLVRSAGQCLRDVNSAAEALEFLVVRAENEPAWLRRANQDFWCYHAYSMGDFRRHAGKIAPALESRLLAIVLHELRSDLESCSARNRYMYEHGNDYFWREKEGEFLKTALSVVSSFSGSERVVLYCAQYIFHCLEQRSEAIRVLKEALDRNILGFNAKFELVGFLHHENRYKESISIIEGLMGEQPDNLEIRVRLMRAFFHTAMRDMLARTLKDADAHFRAKNLWHEGVIAGLGYACVETHLAVEAVPYLREAVALHVKASPNRGVGDGILSGYYGNLASALSQLGRTAEAVDAVSGAIVCWPSNTEARVNELNRLREILSSASDLDAYVAHLDSVVKDTGMENPILRKAIGQVYLDKSSAAKAETQLKLAVEARPNDPETRRMLVDALDRQEKKEEAVAVLLEAAELSMHDAGIFTDLCNRYTALGRAEEGERAATNLVEMSPLEAEGHKALAIVRQNQGRWEEAADQWRGVIRARMKEPEGWLGLAEALSMTKNLDEAQKTIEHVLNTKWEKRFGDAHERAREIQRKIKEKNR